MNGRIYDPVLGRFMTPDPFVQDPNNLQSYNRYAYCLNSPIGCTDPSGHFWQIVVAVIAAAEVAKQAGIIDSGLARTIQGIALSSLFLPGGVGNIAALGPIGNAALGGFVGGLVSGGSVESGLQGAFSAALFNVAGSIPGLNDAGRVAAHAVVGCVSASAGGGSCAQGAVSAAVGELTTIAAGEFGIKDVVARGVITAVAGGITAQASGGKFANGALTAGFGYLFNACSNGQCGASPEESGAYSGANTGADQIGASALKIGASLIPGAAAAECLGGCSAVAWGMAALDFVPGGKPAASVLRLSGFRGSLGPNSFHALDRAIERGVSPQAILDTVRNPTVRIEQGGGKTLLLTNQAAVVLDKSGQAVTIWGGAQHSQKTLELLRNATTKP